MKTSQVWDLRDGKTLSLRTIFERQCFGKRRQIASISARVIFNEVSNHKFTLTAPTLFLSSFFPNAPFLYPWKTSENRKVF